MVIFSDNMNGLFLALTVFNFNRISKFIKEHPMTNDDRKQILEV